MVINKMRGIIYFVTKKETTICMCDRLRQTQKKVTFKSDSIVYLFILLLQHYFEMSKTSKMATWIFSK